MTATRTMMAITAVARFHTVAAVPPPSSAMPAATPPPPRSDETAASSAGARQYLPHHPLDTPAHWDSPRTYPNAGEVIKTYIQQAESRRTSSRFNTARPRPGNVAGDGQNGGRMVQSARLPAADDGDARLEEEHVQGRPAARTNDDYGGGIRDVAAVAGLFLGKHKYTARRPSGQAAPKVMSVSSASPGTAVARRKLQTDLATLAMAPRPPPVVLGGSKNRARHNLAAKLDTIARTSPWMRRRVVLGDEKGICSMFRSAATTSPRHAGGNNNNAGNNAVLGNNFNGKTAGSGVHEAASEAEMEKRVMAAFSRIVRRWRERKKQSEQAALSIVHGQGGAGGNAGAGGGTNARFAPKLQRELDAQSSNVVSILSRRMIREVPALKFFDDTDEAEATTAAGRPKGKDWRSAAPGGAPPATAKPNETSPLAVVAAKARARHRVSEPPRGVCYTLDESGCRRIKMQSGVLRAGTTSSSASSKAASSLPVHDQLEGISMETAMGKSLRRKMARRVKSKRFAILRIGDNFEKSQRDMALKLSAKLALHQAESDKMFSKKMTVLCSDAAAAPPYLAQRELALARARVRKAALIEKCRMLHSLGAVLRHIENTGEMTGQDISAGELQFLEVFRCIAETDQVLTPLLAEGVKRELSDTQRDMPLVSDLFRIFDQHVSGDQTAIEDAWSSPTVVPPTG